MLGAKDLVRYGGPCHLSSHCLFKSFSNARQECDRSPGSGRCPVCLPCLWYYCHLCELPLRWEVDEFKTPLEDPSYDLSNLRPAGPEQPYGRAISTWRRLQG